MTPARDDLSAMTPHFTKDSAYEREAHEFVCVLAQKAIELIGAEGGCAGIRRPEGLECLKYFRKGEALPLECCFPLGDGLPGWLILHKSSYLTNDAPSDPRIRREFYQTYGVRSVLSTPILDANGEVIAFFELHNRLNGSGFDDRDEQLMLLVSQLASFALQKALAYSRKVAVRRHEQDLRQSEERFRLLVEGVQDYSIFMLDPEGRVSSWNKGAELIKGYEASEIMGRHFSCFYPEEDIRSGKPQKELEVATRDGRMEDEGWRLRKDGSRFWANVLITAIRDDSGRLVGFAKVTRDTTEKMKAQALLQEANERLANEVRERTEAQQKLANSESALRQLSLHLLRTQEEERRRIGRDLHDSLGQYLSVLKMKLDSVADSSDMPRQDIRECASLAEECITEVRTMSYLLYPPMLEEKGLKSAIPWYLDGFTKRTGIKTSFEVSPDLPRPLRDVELALFRVLQESLINVHRHSGSPSADIRLLEKEGGLVLEIRDKGKGIPADLERSGQDSVGSLGVGLRGMKERMQHLGGKLELTSTSEGTRVTATVPIEQSSSGLAK